MASFAISQNPILSAVLTPRTRAAAAAKPRLGFVKRFQIAQMARALNALPETELERMGINRRDVDGAARRMILEG